MSQRQLILDTETTGIRVEDGHRIIEIGCVEMINRKLTGNHFHEYINPEREIDAGALAVHGISNHFLAEKPTFEYIVDKLIEFISDAELIIHNAPFDVGFLNYEFKRTGRPLKSISSYCRVTDTLVMARQMHVGQRNSLDALCKRYGIDNTKRELHGALLDAHLLAQVYLAMTGGQGSFFDDLSMDSTVITHKTNQDEFVPIKKQPLKVIKANTDEITQHQDYLDLLQKQGKCVWRQDES